MKNKEPKNNFKKYQASKVSSRLEIIEKHLLKLKKIKTKFKNITALASNVAIFISEEENTSCNKSTLIRNKEYKKKLQDYLDIGKPNQLGALIDLTAQLSSSNAENENLRLKQYIKQLENQVDNIQNNKTLPIIHTLPNNLDIDFALTCKSLSLLVKYFDSIVAVDEKNGTLVDLSKKVNNVIVDRNTLKAFIKWGGKDNK